jgi:hypothetical protein
VLDLAHEDVAEGEADAGRSVQVGDLGQVPSFQLRDAWKSTAMPRKSRNVAKKAPKKKNTNDVRYCQSLRTRAATSRP